MRAFSEREKEYIKAQLIKAAEKLFAEQGFTKTSIAELARAAGIGKGTFYMFYSSKDELLWDLHNVMHTEWQGRFTKILEKLIDSPEEALSEFLHAAFNIFNHPLVLKLQQTGDFERVYRALSHDELDEHSDMSLVAMVPFIAIAQQAGAVIDGDPLVIGATIRSVCFLAIHQADIGEDIYPQVKDLLISIVAKGLARRKNHD